MNTGYLNADNRHSIHIVKHTKNVCFRGKSSQVTSCGKRKKGKVPYRIYAQFTHEMASISKHKNGHRVQVCVHGKRESRVFRTKRDASNWGTQREIDLEKEIVEGPGSGKTLRDALIKYRDEASPKKRGGKLEINRIGQMLRLNQLPLSKLINDVTGVDLSNWRDQRLLVVQPESFLRECSLLSSVFGTAKIDWGWLEKSPMPDFRKPPKGRHRDVILKWPWIKAMLRRLGYSSLSNFETVSERVGIALLIALRTGMRQGEIAKIKRADVSTKTVRLHITKNGQPRDVPLSPKAKRLFEKLSHLELESVVGVDAGSISTLFARARKEAGLTGFTFHDARHTAATMIVRNGKLDVLYLCKMFGWKDPKQAMTYFNPTADELADRL